MSTTIKKMMQLDLEFIDKTGHGFINWVDLETGNTLASLGQGSTGLDSEGNSTGGVKYLEWNLQGVDFIKVIGGGIQFDEQRSLSIDSTRDTYDINGNINGTEGYISSQIQLNNPDYTDVSFFEPANVVYEFNFDLPDIMQDPRYIELEDIKTNYADNTNAMILEHENAIAFANPVSKRIMGLVDTVNEAFVWYGAFSLGDVVDDSSFEIKRTDVKYNLTINAETDKIPEIGFKYENTILWSLNITTNNFQIKNTAGYGIELLNDEDAVRFTGEIYYQDTALLEYFYTRTQLDDGILDFKYYTETELDVGILDNRYYTETELDAGMLDNRYYTETELNERISKLEDEDKYYDYIDGDWVIIELGFVDEDYDLQTLAPSDGYWYAELEDQYYRATTVISTIEINDIDDLPKIIDVDDVALADTDIYEWDGTDWILNAALSEEDYYTTIVHKSDIVDPNNGDVFKISATSKYYEYVNDEFVLIDNPLPYYADSSHLPTQYNLDDRIVKLVFI